MLLFWVATRIGLHLTSSKKLISFLILNDNRAAELSQFLSAKPAQAPSDAHSSIHLDHV